MRSGRIELPLPAWQAGVLPLNDDRFLIVARLRQGFGGYNAGGQNRTGDAVLFHALDYLIPRFSVKKRGSGAGAELLLGLIR